MRILIPLIIAEASAVITSWLQRIMSVGGLLLVDNSQQAEVKSQESAVEFLVNP
jgi:hypothetical protein